MRVFISILAICAFGCNFETDISLHENIEETNQALDSYDPEPGLSRWNGVPGANVEAGETNTQTPDKVKEAIKLIKDGKIFNLGHVYEPAMPLNPVASWDLTSDPVTVFASQAFNGELLVADIGQVGTQFDALGHFGYLPMGGSEEDILYYNRFTHDEVYGEHGLQKLGVENMKTIFTRGVLIDVKRFLNGNQTLPAGYEIRLADLLYVLDKQKMKLSDIKEGDAVLINTGWEEFWDDGPAAYYAGGPGVPGGTPGIGLQVAEALAERKVVLVGSDNWGVEVTGEGDREPVPPGVFFPVHNHLQAKNGIAHQESMHLGELADYLATLPLNKKTYIFAYIFNPMPIKGGSGSPGIPIAVK